MRNPLLSRGLLVFAATCLVCVSAPALFGQGANSVTGRAPLVQDWSAHHVVFTKPKNAWQAAQFAREPRYWQQYYRQNRWGLPLQNRGPRTFGRSFFGYRGEIGGDWAVSLGAGGVAPGMYAAKYTFNVNTPPSCTTDFAVYPINASTGSTRANVAGTFTGTPGNGLTTSITITPTVGMPATLTLTSSAGTNTGMDFQNVRRDYNRCHQSGGRDQSQS